MDGSVIWKGVFCDTLRYIITLYQLHSLPVLLATFKSKSMFEFFTLSIRERSLWYDVNRNDVTLYDVMLLCSFLYRRCEYDCTIDM